MVDFNMTLARLHVGDDSVQLAFIPRVGDEVLVPAEDGVRRVKVTEVVHNLQAIQWDSQQFLPGIAMANLMFGTHADVYCEDVSV